MSIVNMREKITKVYPGENWAKKVRKMSDLQVMAVYSRMMRKGDIK